MDIVFKNEVVSLTVKSAIRDFIETIVSNKTVE